MRHDQIEGDGSCTIINSLLSVVGRPEAEESYA